MSTMPRMVRSATIRDAEGICELINYYAERGRMLHRSLESVYTSLRDFVVCVEPAEGGERVVGCAAVSINWKDLGELRSLAVAADRLGRGIGRDICRQAIEQARQLGLKRLYALTYEQEFFRRLGFATIEKDALPTKVWRDCIHCPRADNCDETAMVLDLEPETQ